MSFPKLRDVSSRYGAPMGRRTARAFDAELPFKFHLVRVRINSGGYDSGGAYWGRGEPLYWACTDEEFETTASLVYGFAAPEIMAVDLYVRANDREDAKVAVRTQYPNAIFFR